MDKIPVSVIIVTRGEAQRIPACLAALSDFSEIHVVDTPVKDNTAGAARHAGAIVTGFFWNGRYPKKRQWCLDNLNLAHDWVLFVDADELVTRALVEEIRALFLPLSLKPSPPQAGEREGARHAEAIAKADGKGEGERLRAGYFIRSRYVAGASALKHGIHNNKLVLIDRRKIEFPVIDDLDLPGMGEIEGHYQPVLKREYRREKLGRLKNVMTHYTHIDGPAWQERHERYAAWEAGMNRKDAWPRDPVALRQMLKKIFRAMPCRHLVAFAHSYILKAGFLDGKPGLRMAQSRAEYYKMIKERMRS